MNSEIIGILLVKFLGIYPYCGIAFTKYMLHQVFTMLTPRYNLMLY